MEGKRTTKTASKPKPNAKERSQRSHPPSPLASASTLASTSASPFSSVSSTMQSTMQSTMRSVLTINRLARVHPSLGSSSSITASVAAASVAAASASHLRNWANASRFLSSAAPAANNDDAQRLTLYQYQICPFCNYAKAMLAYTNTPYDHVEVNPLTKAELKWSKDYRKVPVATLQASTNMLDDGSDITVLKGSDVIVQEIIRRNPQLNDSSFVHSEASKKWQTFAIDDLAPLLYPNLCNSLSNAYNAFAYVHNVPTFTPLQRILVQSVGSLAMYLAASKIKSKRNITDEVQALEDALRRLEDEGFSENGNVYLSGTDQPCLGDIAVYGVLQGLEGLSVLDLVMREDRTQIVAWYQRMTQEVHGSTVMQ